MPETEEVMVEFGPDDEVQATARRRLPVGEFLAGLAGDRRLVPLAAALGGVALFGSLVSEWQLTVVEGGFFGDSASGSRPLQTTVADLGGWGSGYLTGLFLLVTATVLTLFGPPAGRRYARLTALSAGGMLLAVVAATGSYLGDTSRIVGQIGLNGLEEGQVTLSQGRGIWCAAAGVALVLLSMAVAGRHLPVGAQPVVAAPDGEQAIQPEEAIWSWRRPGTGAEEGLPEAPFDLTVTSTKPFTISQENRDKPSDGISG